MFVYCRCSLFRGFTITRVQSLGFYYSDKCNVEMTNNTFIDNTIGVIIFISKPSTVQHYYEEKTVHFFDNLLIGQSPWIDCEVDRVASNSEHMVQICKLCITVSLFYHHGELY